MGSPANYFNVNTNLWQNQPKAIYTWNKTSALNWTSLSTFVQVAVSPLGDLYGIQTYSNNGATSVQYAYRFNFFTGQWSIVDPLFQAKDIKFDKLGNIYFLDRDNNVVNSNYKALPLIAG